VSSGRTRSNANLRPFKPGQSGNPGGRPKSLANRVRELVGDDGEQLARFMLDILNDEAVPRKERIDAATWLADRGWGRPTTTIATEAAEPVSTTVIVESIASQAPRAQLEKAEPDVTDAEYEES
jgi:hypothetical protein